MSSYCLLTRMGNIMKVKLIRYCHPVEFTIYTVAALIGVGLVMVFSTKVGGPTNLTGDFSFVLRHLIWILLGCAALFAMAYVDYHILAKYKYYLLGVGLAGIALVLIPGIGTEINGARRWLRFGSFFGFQPSDIAKISLLVFVCTYIVDNSDKMREFKKGFCIPFIVIGGFVGLLLLEPDFGTATFMMITCITLLIIGGTRIIFILFTMIAGIPHLHKMLFEVSYRKDRLLAFMDPWKDPSNTGYQIIQSLIALGSGGLYGKGLGGSQQKLYFLPESSNDFILTIIGEEIGFLGIVLVVSLFGFLVWNGIKICKAAPDLFGFLLAFGITFMIGLQAAINIAVVSGAVPTKGIPLPFISAGGSSLFMFMFCVGILINIGKQACDGKKK